MSWRVKRLTREIRIHDRCLFAVESANGVIQIWRKANRWDAADLLSEETGHSQPMQFITALTDTWQADGKPIERGIEPLMFRLRQMDGWMRGSQLEEMRKRREDEAEDLKRQKRNETRAIAADLRKEFAAATNDINTSALDMTDARRKYGNC